MNSPQNVVLIATICNTIADASQYALWYCDGGRQYVVDLSDHIRGSGGLTGIVYRRNRIYVAVQALASRILVLDMSLNVVEEIANENFNDLHSLHIAGDTLFVVSTRNGKLLKHEFATGETDVIAEFSPDAWVSGVHRSPDETWLCCHHLRFFDPGAQGGGVWNLTQGRVVVDALLRPHSLIGYRDGFVVLDSGNARVVYFDPAGIRRVHQLHGFLRGSAMAGADRLLVAGGPHRTISRKNPTGEASKSLRDVAHERMRIFQLEAGELTRTFAPELPGFEIYDLLVLPGEVALAPAEDRVVAVGRGTFARFYYVTLADALFRLNAAREVAKT